MPAVRLAHFSDIHLTTRPLGWKLSDWLTKRVTGLLNLYAFGRADRFAEAETVLKALIADIHERRPDHVIFSGDATGLAFEAEYDRVLSLFDSMIQEFSGLAVPGNHDYYTPAAAASGLFERAFATWQHGERPGGAPYPFAQHVGHVTLLGVNSATGNRWLWDAGGSVNEAQLGCLEQLPRFSGPLILVTHYPICRADGTLERHYHGLRNLNDAVAAASRIGVSLWLHGHQHCFYAHPRPLGASFSSICAGSATQKDLWSYGEYTIEDLQLFGRHRRFDPGAGRFVERETFSLQLRIP